MFEISLVIFMLRVALVLVFRSTRCFSAASHSVLTLLDGITEGSLKLLLVGLLDVGKVLAPLLVLDGVGTDDASQLVHLGLELLVVLGHHRVEGVRRLAKSSLASRR